MSTFPLKISDRVLDETLCHNDFPIVNLKITYPNIENISVNTSINRINRYYMRDCQRLRDFAKKCVMPDGICEFERHLENSRPFTPFEVTVNYNITKNDGKYLSLYRDIFVNAGTRYTSRISETWTPKNGWPVFLSDLFPWHKNYKKQILDSLFSSDKNEYRNMARHFKRENFYLADDDLVIFYQPGDIAKVSDGIRAFSYTLKG